MTSRRRFIKASGTLALGSFMLPNTWMPPRKDVGLQLYSVRKEMLADAVGTLKTVAQIGFKELESARSQKGNYYGLKPAEIKKIVADLGMTVRSGHVHVDENFHEAMDQAAEVGQDYLICSSLPFHGQTIANYEKCADIFNKAAEDCEKHKLIFGYHNHAEEFEKVNGKVLYDILLEQTDPNLVKMEMDIGWLIVTGNDPYKYFAKYPSRFHLWHLKDMDLTKKVSVEFGKGGVDIKKLMKTASKSGMKHYFVEQEEYAVTAIQSLKDDMKYLNEI